MVFTAIIFFIAAIGAITGAFGVVLLRNPFYSVLALAVHLVSLAALFLLLRAEFVAAAQVIVYAGAVMVLYVFVVAYVGGGEQLSSGGVLRVLGPLFALALAIELCIAMLGAGLKGVNSKGAAFVPRLRQPALDRRAVPDQVPVPVRGRVDPAARGRGRRGRARAAPAWARARRAVRTPGQRSPAGVDRDDGRGRRTSHAGARRRAHVRRGRAGRDARQRSPRSGGRLVNIGWYLAVSAIIFCIGAGGVLVRRNPLVVLLCLELMLNAANLALVAFARMWGNEDGQVFALIVMVVAACEVTVGLGLVVAIYRRQPADRRR